MANDAIRIPVEPVTSSNIAGIGYDGKRRILAVQFLNGAIFHYANVDAIVADDLLTAESVGRFYSLNVRGKFTGDKMTGPCPACQAQGWIEDPCACGAGVHQREERKEKQ